MTQTTAADSNWLKIILNATAIANICDNAASAPLTNIYVSLHTGTPGTSGTQTTNECAYTSYARVAVARTSGGWTITNNAAVPVATITFPAATGGTETATFMGIGSASSGSGVLYWYGSISPSVSISSGVTPSLTTSTTITGT